MSGDRTQARRRSGQPPDEAAFRAPGDPAGSLAATAATGRLEFVPGSHRGSCHRTKLAGAPVVAVDTEPGDCTVHFGDVLHAAPPPSGDGPGRRALYLTFMPERAFDFIPAGKGYNDVILARVGW